jgi:single-strand DNA-binding protein
MFKMFGEGRLVKDPQVREVNGTKLAEFTLATNEFRRSKTGGEPIKDTHYFDCVVWDTAAKTIEQYCRKGTRLVVEGRIRQDKWTDKETGNPRSKVVFRVEEFSIVDKRYNPESTSENEENSVEQLEEVPAF